MTIFEKLKMCSGTWDGTNCLHDPDTRLPDISPSTAIITPILGGIFIRFDYDWIYRGKKQEGSMLIGNDIKSQLNSIYWIDTWHMGNKAMMCKAVAPNENDISVIGSYPAPPGPDWGWRIAIAPGDARLSFTMFNISPVGNEDIAVETIYPKRIANAT
jgi:hypothetical protein